MNQLLQNWWAAVSSYFVAPLALLGGSLEPLPMAATLGLLCLILGVILAARGRVTQAWWMLVLVAAASLTPVAIGIADSILGWLGMLFAVLAGAIGLLVGTAIIANNADRRLPVWLIGVFIAVFAAYCAAVGGAFVSLTV